MTRYTLAIVLLLDTLASVTLCMALTQNRVGITRNTLLSVGSSSDMKRPASIAASISEQDRVDGRSDLQQAFSTSVSYLESLSQSATNIIHDNLSDVDEEEDFTSNTNTMTQLKSPRVVLDIDSQKRSYRFDVTLPTSSAAFTSSTCIGLAIRRITKDGKVSDSALDFDTLSLISHDDEKYRTPTKAGERSMKGESSHPEMSIVQLLSDSERMNCDRAGLIVSSVLRGGLAWEAGVRAGDFLVATSATIGDVSYCFIDVLYRRSNPF